MFLYCLLFTIAVLPLSIFVATVAILQKIDINHQYTMQINLGYSIICTYILMLSILMLINTGIISI